MVELRNGDARVALSGPRCAIEAGARADVKMNVF
jgi:hypothetical protein